MARKSSKDNGKRSPVTATADNRPEVPTESRELSDTPAQVHPDPGGGVSSEEHPLLDPEYRAHALCLVADSLRGGTNGSRAALTQPEKAALAELRQFFALIGETVKELMLPREIEALSAQVAELREALNRAQGHAGRADVTPAPPTRRSKDPN